MTWLVVCELGYGPVEHRTQAQAQAWVSRHNERAAREPRFCQGQHTVVRKEPDGKPRTAKEPGPSAG